MRKRSKFLAALIGVLLIAQLCGCGKDKDFTANSGVGGSGQDAESESVQPIVESDEEKADEKEDDLAAEEEPIVEDTSEEQEVVEDNHQAVIRVENRKVFYNEKIVEYDQNDASTLKDLLRILLSKCNDETKIVLDLNQGDDEICGIVESVIRQMGMTAATQAGDT